MGVAVAISVGVEVAVFVGLNVGVSVGIMVAVNVGVTVGGITVGVCGITAAVLHATIANANTTSTFFITHSPLPQYTILYANCQGGYEFQKGGYVFCNSRWVLLWTCFCVRT